MASTGNRATHKLLKADFARSGLTVGEYAVKVLHRSKRTFQRWLNHPREFKIDRIIEAKLHAEEAERVAQANEAEARELMGGSVEEVFAGR